MDFRTPFATFVSRGQSTLTQFVCDKSITDYPGFSPVIILLVNETAVHTEPIETAGPSSQKMERIACFKNVLSEQSNVLDFLFFLEEIKSGNLLK